MYHPYIAYLTPAQESMLLPNKNSMGRVHEIFHNPWSANRLPSRVPGTWYRTCRENLWCQWMEAQRAKECNPPTAIKLKHQHKPCTGKNPSVLDNYYQIWVMRLTLNFMNIGDNKSNHKHLFSRKKKFQELPSPCLIQEPRHKTLEHAMEFLVASEKQKQCRVDGGKNGRWQLGPMDSQRSYSVFRLCHLGKVATWP